MLTPDVASMSEWHQSYMRNHKMRIALDLDLVKCYVPQNVELLECGSIPLLLTTALTRSNYAVTGCDIAPERYASAITRLGLKVLKCDIEREQLPFVDNSFGAVIFNELFEHLRIDPVFTLSEVRRLLTPGGVLTLSSPNLRSLTGVRNFILRNRAYSCSGNVYSEYQKLHTLGHMGHVREYTTAEITEFLHDVGFVVTHVVYRGGPSSGLAHSVLRVCPSLSPFVSYVATKLERIAPGRE
jgi:SAM-dependent methyltransferase